jgi:dTDP-4-dehydrorhamnose reductase
MKVVVTGAGGLLGREVWRLFEVGHELFGIGRTQPPQVANAQWRECDLTDASKLFENVTRINPDLIVHCAAYNNVDGAESDPEAAYRANALAVRNLALACQRFDSELMAVSSDYVFDGVEPPAGGYREFDAAHPLSRYGESKRWGELFAEQLLSRFYVIRTSWLFGPTRPTWIDSIPPAVQAGKPVVAVSDLVSAPTYTPDLAAAIFQLAQRHLFGYYHLTNTGFCSRVQLAEEVLRLRRQTQYRGLKVLTQKELHLPARRPIFSGMNNLAWRLSGFEPLRPWQEALDQHFAKEKSVI